MRYLRQKTGSLRAAILLACTITIAGCATSLSDPAKDCKLVTAYDGPSLRSPISLQKLPSATIDTQRAISPELARQLEGVFAELVESKTDASRASVSVWSPRLGFWSSDFGAEPDHKANEYWWASVGKLITASVIFQLKDEGQLSLDDPLSNWFPDYPNASLITIDNLLTHTGGVFSFNNDVKLQKREGYKSVEMLIDISASHGADFCPGTNWNYSNTGYVMLGRISEFLEGKTFAHIVNARIAQPQGLQSLAVITPTDSADSIVLSKGKKPPSVSDISSVFSAGAYKGTATDMLHVLTAFLIAESVSPQMRDLSFTELYPMFGSPMHYGRGVMVIDVPDPSRPTVWIGHTGGSPHAKALLIYDVEREVFMALALNTQAPAEALANTLMKELDKAP